MSYDVRYSLYKPGSDDEVGAIICTVNGCFVTAELINLHDSVFKTEKRHWQKNIAKETPEHIQGFIKEVKKELGI